MNSRVKYLACLCNIKILVEFLKIRRRDNGEFQLRGNLWMTYYTSSIYKRYERFLRWTRIAQIFFCRSSSSNARKLGCRPDSVLPSPLVHQPSLICMTNTSSWRMRCDFFSRPLRPRAHQRAEIRIHDPSLAIINNSWNHAVPFEDEIPSLRGDVKDSRDSYL